MKTAWLFTFEYPPDFGGGLSTYMKVLTEAHAARPDLSLVVFTLSQNQSGLMSRRYLHPNVQLITINPRRATERHSLEYWVHVSRIFQQFCDLFLTQLDNGLSDLTPPDYIEFADGFGIGALTIQQKLCLNARLANVPIIVTAHTPTYLIDRFNQKPIHKLPNYWTRQLELQALNGADLVIGCSQAILDMLGRELGHTGGALRHHAVLHNPYILSDPNTHETCPSEACDHFYMASRLCHWKGVETAIKAFEVLWTKGIHVPFHIYGAHTISPVTGTQYAAYIRKKYHTYMDAGLLRLHGKRPRAEIDAHARTAYAQVHPSHFDNFPYSLIEAMSARTICIAGLNGGIREIGEHGKDIFLTDVHDTAAFADTLETVMALGTAQRQAIGENARNQVKKHCDPDRYLDKKNVLIADLGVQNKTLKREFPFLSAPHKNCVIPASVARADAPELSIVIPYFNMGPFIDAAISSVAACTLARFEIILVDDGSTDAGSEAKLNGLYAAHNLSPSHLKIVRIPNAGTAQACNTGVKHASAPFISMLDADGVIGAQYYEHALHILKTYDNVSFAGAWIAAPTAQGALRPSPTWNAEPPLHLVMNQTNSQSLVYKRKAFERDGWFDPDLYMFQQNWDGVLSLMAAGHRGVMIPEPLSEYRNSLETNAHPCGGRTDTDYKRLTQKHKDLYDHWKADVAEIMDANDPSDFYHVYDTVSAASKC